MIILKCVVCNSWLALFPHWLFPCLPGKVLVFTPQLFNFLLMFFKAGGELPSCFTYVGVGTVFTRNLVDTVRFFQRIDLIFGMDKLFSKRWVGLHSCRDVMFFETLLGLSARPCTYGSTTMPLLAFCFLFCIFFLTWSKDHEG